MHYSGGFHNATTNLERFHQLRPYQHSYYLVPDKRAEKAYSLLLEAMKQSGKAAIARFTLRMKEHLACVRPADRVLAVSTLYYADEVVAQSTLDNVPGHIKADKRE